MDSVVRNFNETQTAVLDSPLFSPDDIILFENLHIGR